MSLRSKLLGVASLAFLLMSCGGGGGSQTALAPAPVSVTPTAQISVSSKDVLRGDPITITWSSSNASSCSASGDWAGVKATSGSETLTAAKDTNTFTITCGSASSSTSVSSSLYQVSITASDRPNYSNGVTTTTDYVKGINLLPYAHHFIVGQDGKMRAFVFPSLFNTGENMPPLELTENSPNKFTLKKIHESVGLGNARSIRNLNAKTSSSAQFVIADTGLEKRLPDNSFPFGDVFLATDSGSGFDFKKISTNKAFYHNVAVGDITADGRDDVVVVNMGQRDGVDKTLYAYTQSPDGSFKQDLAFAEETRATSLFAVSSGSAAIGDLDGDSIPEVVHAAYINAFKPNWGSFRIFRKNSTGVYSVVKTFERVGYFLNAGACVTNLVDIDNDGDLDLIFEMEGNTDPNNTSTFNMEAIEIYRNDGGFSFTRVTDNFLSKSMFVAPADLKWSGGLNFVDFDSDGFLDIFIQQGGFGFSIDRVDGINGKVVDIGSMILRNNGGKGFVSMAGKGMTASFANSDSILTSFKVLDKKGNTVRIFGFDKAGVPTVIELRVGR